ncbi:MAG: hypothetical protein A3H28_14255 [Acidobacteria bacterium RIFCSPLOWO2_02_FULL_61_28]|nr:MAG: hypothetical protein A3H28_14255 [Acidobacteria bacterium RIFCSPLOWO2_02_FULL_61_28]
MEPNQQPESLTERLIALRDRVAENTEILRRMLANIEAKKAEPGIAQSSFQKFVGREEFAALEARVAILERSGRGRP